MCIRDSLKERVTEHVDFPSNQTHILIGNQATWRGNPDHVPLYVGITSSAAGASRPC